MDHICLAFTQLLQFGHEVGLNLMNRKVVDSPISCNFIKRMCFSVNYQKWGWLKNRELICVC